MYGTLPMITFQSLAHTTTTPTVASHTTPVRVLAESVFVHVCNSKVPLLITTMVEIMYVKTINKIEVALNKIRVYMRTVVWKSNYSPCRDSLCC